MRILICPDKFKGSLSAKEASQAIAKGFQKEQRALDIHLHPMADGGDGSLDVLSHHLPLHKQTLPTLDPLGRPLNSHYFTFENQALIELASASGLVLLQKNERNPLQTSTRGTGILMAQALASGCTTVYLFLGGSATNDGGMGIACELGFTFLDANGNELSPIGQNLIHVQSIETKSKFPFSPIKLNLLCDVTNPLFGPKGAAKVYAGQKGADEEQIAYLDQGLKQFADVLFEKSGRRVDEIPGCGAAGGVGAAMVALCGAQLKKGFQAIAELTGLDAQIQQADLVICGEGKLDQQSLQGKVVGEVALLCQQYQKPLALFVGKSELSKQDHMKLGVQQVYSISDLAKNMEDAMSRATYYLEQLAIDSTKTLL